MRVPNFLYTNYYFLKIIIIIIIIVILLLPTYFPLNGKATEPIIF